MKKTKLIAATLAAIMIVSTFASCTSKPKEDAKNTEASSTTAASTTAPEASATLREEDNEKLNEITVPKKELANKTIKWFSNWAMNPPEGDPARTSLELFKNNYGGIVEDTVVAWEERETKLSTLILADDSPDLVFCESFPSMAAKNVYAPVDDYVDLNSDLWGGVKRINDKYRYKGKCYYPIFFTGNGGLYMTYNKKVVEENNLTDPAELLAEGKWDWDAFYDMSIKFCDAKEGNYASTGYWFEPCLALSTGVPLVDFKDGKLVNNVASPEIQRVAEFLEKCNKAGFYNNANQDDTKGIGAGTTLFYPVGSWKIMGTDLTDYAETTDEMMFVPIPKDPAADKHYLPIAPESYALVSGGKNPEGAGAFLDCARLAAIDPTALEIQKNQVHKDFKWTDEMYNMLLTIKDMEQEAGILDFYFRVNDDVKTAVENAVVGVYREGKSWAQEKQSIKGVVDAGVDDLNKIIAG